MKIEDFVVQFPQYEIPTFYYKVEKDFETSVCFYNYYDQIFPLAQVAVKLHLFYFDLAGAQIAYGCETVPALGSSQFPSSKYLPAGEGLMAIVAVPEADLQALAAGKFPIRKQISTGAYVIWENTELHQLDISHEQSLMIKGSNTEKQSSFSNYSSSQAEVERKLIVSNYRLTHNEKYITPEFKIYKNGAWVADYKPEIKLKGRGMMILDLAKIALSIKQDLSYRHQVSIQTLAPNVLLQLTVESIPGSDFHIHHI